jgi:hypothetical protein
MLIAGCGTATGPTPELVAVVVSAPQCTQKRPLPSSCFPQLLQNVMA